ncbi:hypothetical protein B6D60_07665 [candidate division KSB1 bacterium 4484_87]|nr:MAG: hypothetical protein B6D60_07665 [candidate division KSB1 bacterium 4484_87]
MADSVKSKIAIKEPSIFSSEPSRRSEETLIFGFPKEFKRDWIGSLDYRFLKILLATFFIEIGLIFFLTSILGTASRPVNVKKIQQQYAHLLLDNAVNPAPKSTITSESTGSSAIEIKSNTELPISAPETAPPPEENAISISQSNKAHYGVAPLDQRRVLEQSTTQQQSALARKVSQTGILRYLISTPKSDYSEELNAVYANGDANAKLLEQSAEKMDVVRFRSAGAMFQPISKQQLDVLDRLKGSSVEANLSDEMASLEQLDKIAVEREKKVEKLEYQRDELLQPAKSTAKVRPTDQVARAIQAHARAIQNCYQQAVRQNPGLRGKVTFRIAVSPAGRVVDVQILESTIENEKMLRCMVNRIKRWRNFGRIDDAAGVMKYRQSYVFGY